MRIADENKIRIAAYLLRPGSQTTASSSAAARRWRREGQTRIDGEAIIDARNEDLACFSDLNRLKRRAGKYVSPYPRIPVSRIPSDLAGERQQQQEEP